MSRLTHRIWGGIPVEIDKLKWTWKPCYRQHIPLITAPSKSFEMDKAFTFAMLNFERNQFRMYGYQPQYVYEYEKQSKKRRRRDEDEYESRKKRRLNPNEKRSKKRRIPTHFRQYLHTREPSRKRRKITYPHHQSNEDIENEDDDLGTVMPTNNTINNANNSTKDQKHCIKTSEQQQSERKKNEDGDDDDDFTVGNKLKDVLQAMKSKDEDDDEDDDLLLDENAMNDKSEQIKEKAKEINLSSLPIEDAPNSNDNNNTNTSMLSMNASRISAHSQSCSSSPERKNTPLKALQSAFKVFKDYVSPKIKVLKDYVTPKIEVGDVESSMIVSMTYSDGTKFTLNTPKPIIRRRSEVCKKAMSKSMCVKGNKVNNNLNSNKNVTKSSKNVVQKTPSRSNRKAKAATGWEALHPCRWR